LFLLDIHDLSQLFRVISPPTAEELLAFERGDSGCIQVSVKKGKFRLDYNNSSTSNFNREAIEEFTKDFQRLVTQSGWYRDKINDCPIPDEYLTNKSIIEAAKHHFDHIKKRYKEEVQNPIPGQKEKKQEESARSRRKTVVRFYETVLNVYSFNLNRSCIEVGRPWSKESHIYSAIVI
jgi:hypothetical protein